MQAGSVHKESIFSTARNGLTLRELRDIVVLQKLGLVILVLKSFWAQRTAWKQSWTL